jgi:hypothetical protein
VEKPAHKAEFPPLLPQGFHPYTLEGLKRLCVDGFAKSTLRPEIWAGLTAILDQIVAVNIVCDVWLDGSYTTQKLEPDDVDFVFIMSSHYRTEGTPEQQHLIEWLINREDEPKKLFLCHTYVILEFPADSPWYQLALDEKKHFEEGVFGYSVTTHEPKGIVLLRFEEKREEELDTEAELDAEEEQLELEELLEEGSGE